MKAAKHVEVSDDQQDVVITLETSHLKRSNIRVGCKFHCQVLIRSTTNKFKASESNF